jgi:hypothetical protein
MSLCKKAALVFYTMEDYPRENSPYCLMNAALREKKRENVVPWRNYIWLLLHALRDLPPSEVMVVIRGCRKLASELGSQSEEGESFVWSGFSSTATTVDVMQTFLGKDGARTLFQLQLRPGIARSLKEFSFFPDERTSCSSPSTPSSRSPPCVTWATSSRWCNAHRSRATNPSWTSR